MPYIMNRIQIVYVDGHESYEIKVVSGVPQRSTLGLLLFLIYINDAVSALKVAKVLIFRYDTKVMYRVTCQNDVLKLRNDLDTSCERCEELGLRMNRSKCTVTSFSRSNSSIDCLYMIGNQQVQVTDSYKDLGVIFDLKLSFKLL